MDELKLESFETDFWKDVARRKTWDTIIPGELRETRPVTLTKELIAKFDAGVGEDNPLYFDEEYAKKTIWGGIVAPPSIHILLMFACTGTEDWMRSPGTINASHNWFYNVPPRPRDTIHMRGTALGRFIKTAQHFVRHDNGLTKQRRE